MSFPWIKIETNTPDKPEVIAMAAKLRIKDSDTVTGKLVRLWAWADANSVDGHKLSITRAHIDRLTACRGFAAAMESVGWLIETEGLMTFPGFERHNGESAKKRALATRKKQIQRGTHVAQRGGQMSPPDGGQKEGQMSPSSEGQNGGLERERERERVSKETLSPPPGRQMESGRMDEIKRRINGLRPEWGRPARWTYQEDQHLFGGAAAQMEELLESEWKLLAAYMAADLPKEAAYWQPLNRDKFAGTFSNVWASAQRWAGKTGRPVSEAKPKNHGGVIR